MKILLITFLFFAFGLTIAQESRFKEGEKLNIWATSGLNMRDKPDAKAAKLMAIPYGAKVIVQPNIGVKILFEVEEFKGFIVKGYWLLVKYGDTQGFVFDGFLSRLPAPVKETNKNLVDYLDSGIGKIGDKFNVKIYDEKIDSMRYVRFNEEYDLNLVQEYLYHQKYKFDIDFTVMKALGSQDFKLQIPNSDLYQGYILLKNYFEKPVFKFNVNQDGIELSDREEEGRGHFTIIKANNTIIVTGVF